MPRLDMHKVAQLLEDSASTVLRMKEERAQNLEKMAQLQQANEALVRRMEVEKLAAEMHSKGLHSDTPLDELTARLEKRAEEGKLPVIKEALSIAGPNMLGDTSLDEKVAGAGPSELERCITGYIG